MQSQRIALAQAQTAAPAAAAAEGEVNCILRDVGEWVGGGGGNFFVTFLDRACWCVRCVGWARGEVQAFFVCLWDSGGLRVFCVCFVCVFVCVLCCSMYEVITSVFICVCFYFNVGTSTVFVDTGAYELVRERERNQ